MKDAVLVFGFVLLLMYLEDLFGVVVVLVLLPLALLAECVTLIGECFQKIRKPETLKSKRDPSGEFPFPESKIRSSL